MMRKYIDGWLASGLFLVALSLRVGILWIHPFDGLYGQDPYAYYDYARVIFGAFRGGALTGPFYWPLGYPLMVAPLFLVLGITPQAGQIVSLIAGSLIAPLAYVISRELTWDDEQGGRWAGVAAGGVAAVSGQLIQSSLVMMADAPALFWATFSLWSLLRFVRRRGAAWLFAAAVGLAMATITRWVMGLLILPWSVYILGWGRSEWLRLWWTGALALAGGALILILQLRLSAANPASFSQHAWVTSWSLANAVRRVFDNPDGHFEYALPVAVFNLQACYHPFYLLPLLTPWVGWGAWARRRNKELILVIGWMALIYGFLIGIPYENFRFPLAYFTPAALLTGMGFQAMRQARVKWAEGLLVLSLAGMLGFAARGLLYDPRSVLAIKQRELEAVEWLQAHVPPGAPVMTLGMTIALQMYTDLDAIEIYRERPETLADRVCASRGFYAYLDVENLEDQWRGLAPDVNYRWLRDGPGLETLGWFQNHTLFKAGHDCK